ncbi:MAG TPA: selenide, water dikinase SelD, partial [Myxococcales bacterium]|nr:selenide, water dikinase SelD [Myxococcales bacterium]
GLCVVGEVSPERLVRNATARPGDVLVLTKPIGTGVVATALKAGVASREAVRAAVASMATLNRAAAEAMLHVGVHAATDVTGFGLLGHLREILLASALAVRVRASAVPLLPEALSLGAGGHIPGGTRRNMHDLGEATTWADDVPAALRVLLCDAQTSGGLLIAVAPERAQALVEALRARHTPAAAVIGEVLAPAAALPAGSLDVVA